MQTFIAMPFDPTLDFVFKSIQEASKLAGFVSVRADEIFQHGVIVDQIYEKIQKSDCVVGVLTGKNPNVYYELGIAHGLSKPLILLHPKSNMTELPFDIRHNRVITYEPEQIDRIISLIQAQLGFVKNNLSEKITSEDFIKNIDLTKDDIKEIREHLLADYGLLKLSLEGMELLERGKGILLRFASPFGERVVVSIDSNRMITRSEKI
ncbi:MAG: hypothetical protein HPY72_11460 [Anaerolineae bacterium]|nr:hypothetical protein [Anaerolineae bacterium]